MDPCTAQLWALQDRHVGDRARLFGAVGQLVNSRAALYPGSFVDIAASMVFPAVTYIDSDRRAAEFFADESGVQQIIAAHPGAPAQPQVEFVAADYRDTLDLPDGGFDLLISLYAGFVSEHCTRYLRIGGDLLVNPSHGDAAMASIDTRYRLRAVVTSGSGRYRMSTEGLDRYLIPKKPIEVTGEVLRRRGRGVAYTRSAFAYLFERVE